MNLSKIGLLFLLASPAFAQEAYTVRCDIGGQKIATVGISSTTKAEASFPGCSVTVYVHGTLTLASITDDLGTPIGNPFTTSVVTGYGIFKPTVNGRFDVVLSGAGITTPTTINDILFNDPAVANTFTANNTFSGNNSFTGNNTFSANNTFSGNNSFSGTTTDTGRVSPGNLNDFSYVDNVQVGALYGTCAAAVTAAGGSNRAIFLAPTYAGTASCPAAINNNINYWNFDSTRLYINNGFNFYQNTGANTESLMHVMGERTAIGSGGSFVTGYFTSTLNNYTQVAGIGLDGISGEANTSGTLSGVLPVIQGAEEDTLVGSTGGTVSALIGVVGHNNTTVGSTTAIINSYGVWGKGCNAILGSVPVNCYGGYFSDQTSGGVGKGSSRNYSMASEGLGLFRYSTGLASGGFDCEDASGALATPHCFNIASDSSINLQAVNASGINLRAVSGSPVANIGTNAFKFFAAPTPQSAAFVGLGKPGLPWANLILGTTGTNAFTFTPASTTAALTLNIPDWGANNAAQGSSQNFPYQIILTSQYTNSTTVFW